MKRNKSNPLKGKLLLDSGLLSESFFVHSAVLICEHGSDGALGIVLNHPVTLSVEGVFVANIADSLRKHLIHVGGPVFPDSFLYLVRNPYSTKDNSLRKVIPGLYMGNSIDDLSEEDLLAKPKDIMFFAGLCGWTRNQLEDEIKNGAWIVSDITTAEVFKPRTLDLWKEKIRSLGDDYLLLSHSTRDPYAN